MIGLYEAEAGGGVYITAKPCNFGRHQKVALTHRALIAPRPRFNITVQIFLLGEHTSQSNFNTLHIVVEADSFLYFDTRLQRRGNQLQSARETWVVSLVSYQSLGVLLIDRISLWTQIARYPGTQEASTPICELSFAAVHSSETLHNDMAFVRLRYTFHCFSELSGVMIITLACLNLSRNVLTCALEYSSFLAISILGKVLPSIRRATVPEKL